jgi:hypothetical protein
MTRSLPRIDWAALGASVGSAALFTLLLLGPFPVGAHYRLWLLGLAIGIILPSTGPAAQAGGRAASRARPTPAWPLGGREAGCVGSGRPAGVGRVEVGL